MKTLKKITLLLLVAVFFIGCASKNEVKTIKIGMCADAHLATMHDSEKRLTTFIDSMNIAKPDFIIELGDFEVPKNEYEKYLNIWNSFSGKKYHVIGNHDLDGGLSVEKAIAHRKMNTPYYSFSDKGFKFIVLNGNDKNNPEEKKYGRNIAEKQLEWLQQELETTQEPIVVFSHQGFGTYPGVQGEEYSVKNAQNIRTLLEKHNKTHKNTRVICCFNGHSHYDYAEEINGIHYITINSMAYKWLGDKYEHIRYSEAVDKEFKWIKYTAPYKDPLFTVVEISTDGTIKMTGKKSEYVGPSPWELGYPESFKKYIKPEIIARDLRFPRINN